MNGITVSSIGPALLRGLTIAICLLLSVAGSGYRIGHNGFHEFVRLIWGADR